MKKILCSFISICLIFSFSITAFAVEPMETESPCSDNKIVDIVDDHITVNDNGYISIDNPDKIISEIGTENYNLILSGIDEVNGYIEDGYLEVSDNGT